MAFVLILHIFMDKTIVPQNLGFSQVTLKQHCLSLNDRIFPRKISYQEKIWFNFLTTEQFFFFFFY